jgi:hypothetical protein
MILNHLLLDLREEFRGTPEYKQIHRKDSFDNWDLAIDTLEAWSVLLPDAAKGFRSSRRLGTGGPFISTPTPTRRTGSSRWTP